MKILAVVNEQVHLDAMAAARRVGTAQQLSAKGLHTVESPDVLDWVTDLWDSIEPAISRAYHQGMEAARPLIAAVADKLDALSAAVTKQAQAVRSIIAERLNTYLMGAIDGALSRVRANINVGGQKLSISNVTVEQKLNISSSLKMSLAEVCEFAAEGEITLSAEYSAG